MTVFTLSVAGAAGVLVAGPGAAPAEAAAPDGVLPDGAWVDEFDAGTLDPRWSIHNEAAEQWHLDDATGALVLTSQAGDTYQGDNSARNVFLLDVPVGDFTVVTSVEAPVSADFQGAGLIAWQDPDNYVRAGVTHVSFADGGPVVIENGVETGAVYSSTFTARPGSTGETLRLQRVGDLITTSYWADGAWVQAAAAAVTFDTIQVGLYALAAGGAPPHQAVFDYVGLVAAPGQDVVPDGTFTLNGSGDLRYLTVADDGSLGLRAERPSTTVALTAQAAADGALTLRTAADDRPVRVVDGRLTLGEPGSPADLLRLTDAGGGRLYLRTGDSTVDAGYLGVVDGTLVVGVLADAVRLTLAVVSEQQASVTIDGDATSIEMSPDLYGLFYEDINYAADGGLYAELVRNRSFEFAATDNASFTGMTAWETVTRSGATGTATVVEDDGRLNDSNRAYLQVQASGPGVGVRNAGYSTGLAVTEGAAYDFTVWARSAQAQTLAVQVESADGATVHAAGTVDVDGSDEWKQYAVTLAATSTTTAGRLAVLSGAAGSLALDMVSLFPADTWDGPVNGQYGLRADIAEMIAAMEPSFLRFPGGCVTNVGTFDTYADSGYTDRRRTYQWKETIGPVEQRPTNWNFWGYNQSYGIGYYEYFLFAEDLGATALPVLSVGANGCGSTIPEMTDDERIERWVADTVDLIEFANGDVSTEWGAVRAGLGHPEPFGMRYIGLGNEENTTTFEANFPRFRDAVEAAYPDITVVSNSGPDDTGARFDALWEFNREQGVAMVDEHYYNDPSWFLANTGRYDDYDRDGPHVFLGEYASRGNTFWNALVEAAYMTGLERNSDLVELASYAPLLANEDYLQWSPDALWFDNDEVWGSPSYYVQKLFSTQRGQQVVPSTAQGGEVVAPDISGGVFLSTWSTSAAYDNLTVTSNATGEVLFADSFDDAGQWSPQQGSWAVADGQYVQSSTSVTDARSIVADAYTRGWTDYTLELDARKVAGSEGFLIGFGATAPNSFYWWNLGGWNNTRSVLQKADNSSAGEVAAIEGHTIETGRTYRVTVEVSGRTVRLSLDGVLQMEYTDPVPTSALHQVVTRDTASGDLVAKLVNTSEHTLRTAIEISDVVVGSTGTAIEMTGAPGQTNTKSDPTAVVPVERTVTGLSNSFGYDLPPYSITFLRIRTSPVVPDTVAPEVSLALDPAEPSGANGWYTGPVTATASATDDSGLAPTVEVDVGTGWVAYTGPVVLDQDGNVDVAARATDAAGNVSEPVVAPVRIDATPPTSTATVDEVARTVTLTGQDETSGLDRLEYRVDGGAWAVATGPVTVGAQATVVEHRGVDVAGNVGQVGTVQVPPDADLVGTRVLGVAIPGAVRVGSPALVVATVRPVSPRPSGAAVRPSGTVEVVAGGAVIGSATIRYGVALVVVDTSALPVGRQSLVLAYSGDDRYAASSGAVSLTVLRARR
ncbi:alpha-L-arabinofuranosidase C-terminal domain-containing protein [Cellulomonas sp. KRMCY2]|uniref:alpha-L-arabinofuranosidase C-terminal domain-containing protein n=1 Tax=Cellulomonas sp. KRMCY2 TaxID=1304865 RepID=UPI00045E95B0|nr:alpha-L-arabinofuranosidase C-terminal domain-containing protein [Cellulomonas sp. KRMCY2]